jgi:hypothetical protein
LKWTWHRTKEAPPIPDNVEYEYNRRPLWGQYSSGFNAFGPYRRPILDATGGGQLYGRQLNPYSPNTVQAQAFTPVSITGDGSESSGVFQVMPLVNVSTPESDVVSVQTVNGVTNITLGNTTQTVT